MTSSTLPRITTRVDEATQSLLQRAAKISGTPSLNAFVLNAAVEKAKEIIHQEHILQLSQRDSLHLLDILDQPTQANDRLSAAFKRHAINQD